ncbi:MAG TPA: ATP-binding protein [Fibrobacteria bacterium]|nr:ATP-binding protein [Fibrobacteria bacterium]
MMSAKPLPQSWTFWPVPDPDVFGDKVYSWKFIFAINLPMVVAFYALLIFTPLREWTGADPFIFAAGCAIQLGAFAGVLVYGHRRIHPGIRELITYSGNLAATISLPLSTDQPLLVIWVLYLLIVFFEAFGNPKAFTAFCLTLVAPWASLLSHMDGPQAGDKVLIAALMTGIGGVVYLMVAYVAGWTREGALAKAQRARETGVLEERQRLQHRLDGTLGAALAEIALWHEVALASDVQGAQSTPLARARTKAREALTELRALAADIDSQPANMAGLAGEIQRRAGNLCREAGIAFEFQIGMLGRLSLADAYNTAMIAIEAVENAVAHAKASRITVILSGAPLGVTVEDDGQGFDPAQTAQGRGLRNLAALAEALDAPLEITSAPGRGTRVRVFTTAG